MIGSTNSIWDINKNSYEQLVNYTMLYDYGDECTDITGGWTTQTNSSNAKSNNTFEKRSDCLYHSSGSTTGGTTTWQGLFITNNQVSLSGYSKAICSAVSNKGTYYYSISFRVNSRPSKACGDLSGMSTLIEPYLDEEKLKITAFDTDVNHYVSTHCRASSYSLYALGLLKQDNWQELCTIVGLTSSDYADEAALCTNSTAISTILSNKNAVEFMIKQCTGSFMGEFVASSTCLTALNNSQYKTIIMANEHWAKFLNMIS